MVSPIHSPILRRNSEAYLLFGLLALYGPSVRLLGEFRYVEIAVLLLLVVNFDRALHYLGKWEKRFARLFLLTAFMQVISDLVNDASMEGTLKRSFTYIILSLLIIGIRSLSRGDPMRLRWILAGYSLSYVTVLYTGQSASRYYELMAWRLGLGTAVTISICLVPLWLPRTYQLVGPALLAMSVVHLMSSSRALAALVFVAGIAASWGAFYGRSTPPAVRPMGFLLALAVGLFSILVIHEGAKWATEERLFPPDLQEKMELQFAHPYGIMAAGRPDTVAALFGITKRPLLGFGSTNADPEVMRFYHYISASTYVERGDFTAQLEAAASREWVLGMPSHSHLLGAWVDAGIIAAVSWLVVIAFAAYVLYRSTGWRHPLAPLFLLVSIFVLWDTLFSPGPHRMDVAIRLAVLIYAVELMEVFDASYRQSARPFHGRQLRLKARGY